MRAIVFFCLLLEAFCNPYGWMPDGKTPAPSLTNECLSASCGCCLMEKQMTRMRRNFQHVAEEMKKYLAKSREALDLARGRSAFSVSLTNEMSCSDPATSDQLIIYSNVLLNLGGSYNETNGIFTIPQSGVYCLTVTIHNTDPSGEKVTSCARLEVNGKEMVALLSEKRGHDPQDSSSIVVAWKLEAGDEVSVLLPKGCVVCNADQNKHYNTFTGFLLYKTS